jgi:uncharacterized membrane protein
MEASAESNGRFAASIWLGAALYALVYFALDFNRYVTYEIGGDFGLFMQSLSDPSGLLRNSVEGSHFAAHFSPIYTLLVPLVRWTQSCLPVIAVQVLAGALVAPGLFVIARDRLPPHLAVALASLAFVYPALAGLMFDDPYENVFAPVVTVWLFAAVYRRNWTLAAVMVVAALAIKEDQAIFLAWSSLLALIFAQRTHDGALRNFALFALGASFLAFALFVFVIRPEFATAGAWPALTATFRVAHGDASAGLSVAGRLGYLAEIVVPLAFLPLAAPRVLLFALPALCEVLLSRNSLVWTMGHHYAGVWIGYVLVATVFGAARLYRVAPALARRCVAAALLLCLADLTFASPTHWRRYVHLQTAHDRALDTLLAEDVPRDAPLGTHDELYGHLWTLPATQRGLDGAPPYALIDLTMRDSGVAHDMLAEIADKRFGIYRLVWQRDDVVLYRRQRGPWLAGTGYRKNLLQQEGLGSRRMRHA